jgi:hypothetical protein
MDFRCGLQIYLGCNLTSCAHKSHMFIPALAFLRRLSSPLLRITRSNHLPFPIRYKEMLSSCDFCIARRRNAEQRRTPSRSRRPLASRLTNTATSSTELGDAAFLSDTSISYLPTNPNARRFRCRPRFRIDSRIGSVELGHGAQEVSRLSEGAVLLLNVE